MELVAWSEGLGTCFVGIRGEQQDAVKNLLGIPEEMELITVLPFGYRVQDAPRSGGTPRKPMTEITHGERFGAALIFE
jgi:nitroreductase